MTPSSPLVLFAQLLGGFWLQLHLAAASNATLPAKHTSNVANLAGDEGDAENEELAPLAGREEESLEDAEDADEQDLADAAGEVEPGDAIPPAAISEDDTLTQEQIKSSSTVDTFQSSGEEAPEKSSLVKLGEKKKRASSSRHAGKRSKKLPRIVLKDPSPQDEPEELVAEPRSLVRRERRPPATEHVHRHHHVDHVHHEKHHRHHAHDEGHSHKLADHVSREEELDNHPTDGDDSGVADEEVVKAPKKQKHKHSHKHSRHTGASEARSLLAKHGESDFGAAAATPACPETKVAQCSSIMPAHDGLCGTFYMYRDGLTIICGAEFVTSPYSSSIEQVWTGRCLDLEDSRKCSE